MYTSRPRLNLSIPLRLWENKIIVGKLSGEVEDYWQTMYYGEKG